MRLRSPKAFFLKSYSQEPSDLALTDAIVDDTEEEFEADEEGEDGLPIAIIGPHSVASQRVFDDCEAVIQAFMSGEIYLRRLEGIRTAYTGGNRLYIEGAEHHFPAHLSVHDKEVFAQLVTSSNVLRYSVLIKDPSVIIMTVDSWRDMLSGLLSKGYFYPVDAVAAAKAD